MASANCSSSVSLSRSSWIRAFSLAFASASESFELAAPPDTDFSEKSAYNCCFFVKLDLTTCRRLQRLSGGGGADLLFVASLTNAYTLLDTELGQEHLLIRAFITEDLAAGSMKIEKRIIKNISSPLE